MLNLAAAGGMDLAYASDLVTDAMASLNIEANKNNVDDFGNKLAMAASKANANVSQLGEAILTVGGTAANLKNGTTELTTALGLLANVGIKARRAAPTCATSSCRCNPPPMTPRSSYSSWVCKSTTRRAICGASTRYWAT